jgi:hypothetical protein
VRKNGWASRRTLSLREARQEVTTVLAVITDRRDWPAAMPAVIQSRTDKHSKFDISGLTKKLAILIADSNSGWPKTSKNTPPKFFPRVVVLASILGQNLSKNCGCAK